MKINEIVERLINESSDSKIDESILNRYAEENDLSNVDYSLICGKLYESGYEIIDESESEDYKEYPNELIKVRKKSKKEIESTLEDYFISNNIKAKDFWAAFRCFNYTIRIKNKYFEQAFGAYYGKVYRKHIEKSIERFINSLKEFQCKKEECSYIDYLFTQLKCIREICFVPKNIAFRSSVFETMYYKLYGFQYELSDDDLIIHYGKERIIDNYKFLNQILHMLHEDYYISTNKIRFHNKKNNKYKKICQGLYDYLERKGLIIETNNSVQFSDSLFLVSAIDTIPSNVLETYSAFANTNGGTIIFGIKKENGMLRPIDIPDPLDYKNMIVKTLNDKKIVSYNTVLESDINIINIDHCNIIEVTVREAKRSQKPVYINDDIIYGSFYRDDINNMHYRIDDILSCMRSRSKNKPNNQTQ